MLWKELADKCKPPTVPNRELDAEIAAHIQRACKSRGLSPIGLHRDYTSSIEAASIAGMLLFPEMQLSLAVEGGLPTLIMYHRRNYHKVSTENEAQLPMASMRMLLTLKALDEGEYQEQVSARDVKKTLAEAAKRLQKISSASEFNSIVGQLINLTRNVQIVFPDPVESSK